MRVSRKDIEKNLLQHFQRHNFSSSLLNIRILIRIFQIHEVFTLHRNPYLNDFYISQSIFPQLFMISIKDNRGLINTQHITVHTQIRICWTIGVLFMYLPSILLLFFPLQFIAPSVNCPPHIQHVTRHNCQLTFSERATNTGECSNL